MKGLYVRAALAAALAVAIAGCTASAGSGTTEKIADDGGDLGKAWLDLNAAMEKGDAQAASALLDGKRWNLANKKPSWFQQFADGEPGKPMGGRRNGDRATLFLDNSDADGSRFEYRHVGATWSGSSWVFDGPMTLGSSFSPSDKRDCAETPDVFPCGVETGQVSGTIKLAAPGEDDPAQYVLLDGFAARKVPTAGGATTTTEVVLSTQGINPAALAMSSDPDHVYGWLGWPVMKLAVAPDGKSAEVEYYGGGPRKKMTVTDGLTIDASAPGRMKGTLKTDVPDVGHVDVAFDLSTASQ